MTNFKKKILKVSLIIMCFLTVMAFFVDTPVEASEQDLMLYRVSMSYFFGVIALGIGMQLDVFRLKNKIAFLRSTKIVHKIIYWCICFCLACSFMVILQNMMSKEYQERYGHYMAQIEKDKAEKKAKENTNTNIKDEKKKKEDSVTEKEKKNKTENSVKENNSKKENVEPQYTKWEKIAQDLGNYEQVLLVLGKNFRTEAYTDDIALSLPDDYSRQVVKELYEYYQKNDKLPKDFKNTFNKYISGVKYQDMEVGKGEKVELFDVLQNSFVVSFKYNKNGMASYFIDMPDYSADECKEDKDFLIATGYVAEGVRLYKLLDGKMTEIGQVKEIQYGAIIDEVAYDFAVNLESYEDAELSGWKDGIMEFSIKKESGIETYYVKKTDPSRPRFKHIVEEGDYFNWKKLWQCADKKNKQVYMGTEGCKRYMFTILEYDKIFDIMLVQYPSGNTEYKSYSAITNNNSLYVIE